MGALAEFERIGFSFNLLIAPYRKPKRSTASITAMERLTHPYFSFGKASISWLRCLACHRRQLFADIGGTGANADAFAMWGAR